MANTINRVGNTIYITDIDSDWAWSDMFPYASIPLVSIQFNGAGADDVCIIYNGSIAGGAPMFDSKVEDGAYDQRYKLYLGANFMPVLDFSAGTYTAGSKVQINMNL